MVPWLRMQKEIRGSLFPKCRFVFFQPDGKAIGEFRKTWKSACKRAGVEGLHFHDLRRSAVRNMNRDGVTEKVAMQVTGHKPRSIFDRYNIVSDRDVAEAGKKMEARSNARLDGVGAPSLGTLLGTPADLPEQTPEESVSKLLN